MAREPAVVPRHCDCPTLNAECANWDLRTDAIAALDASHHWCGETAVVLTRLEDALHNRRSRMEREAATEGGCAECDDHASNIADELACPNA